MTDPQIFEGFPTLPPELQLKIWQIAVMEIPGRTISVTLCSLNQLLVVVQGPRALPALLHACRNSRAEARKYYTPFWRFDHGKNFGVVWVSHDHDKIFLQTLDEREFDEALYGRGPGLDDVQYVMQALAVYRDCTKSGFVQGWRVGCLNLFALDKFTGLQELELVTESDQCPPEEFETILVSCPEESGPNATISPCSIIAIKRNIPLETSADEESVAPFERYLQSLC
jgi:2EXR family